MLVAIIAIFLLLAVYFTTKNKDVPVTSIDLGDFILDTAHDRIVLSDTPDKFYEHVEASFTVFSDNYFSQNVATVEDAGHFVFGVRVDSSKLTTEVHGAGMVFGNVSGARDGNPYWPSTQVETWCNKTNPERDNYLLQNSSPSPILKDGKDYDVKLISSSNADGSIRSVRYTITDGIMSYDSGVLVDPNRYYDVSKTGVFIAHVFRKQNAENWKINFKNVKIVCY